MCCSEINADIYLINVPSLSSSCSLSAGIASGRMRRRFLTGIVDWPLMSRSACVASSSSSALRFFEDTIVDASEGAEDVDFPVAEPDRRVVDPVEDLPVKSQLAFKEEKSLKFTFLFRAFLPFPRAHQLRGAVMLRYPALLPGLASAGISAGPFDAIRIAALSGDFEDFPEVLFVARLFNELHLRGFPLRRLVGHCGR